MTMTFPDTVTIWAQAGRNVSGGQTFAAPVSVRARWEEKQEQFIDPKGVMSLSRAVVFLDGYEATAGDWIFEGDSIAASPDPGSFAIRQTSRIPDLRKIRIEHKAYL